MFAAEERPGDRRMIRLVVRAGAIVAFAMVLLSGLGGAGTVSETDVTGCTTIDSPGIYTVTTDINNSSEANCIVISASDVVFDGQGHTIDGTSSGGSVGINVTVSPGLSNVTVREVTVTDWEYGVWYAGVSDSRIENVTVRSIDVPFPDGEDEEAIRVTGGSNVTLVDSRSQDVGGSVDEGDGIQLTGTGHKVVNNTVVGTGDHGITIVDDSGSEDIVIRDNYVNTGTEGSNGYGVNANEFNTTVRNNTVVFTDETGIRSDGANATVVGNTVTDIFGSSGIEADHQNAVVEDNYVANTTKWGLLIDGSNATVRNNTVTNTSSTGIRLDEVYATAVGNTVTDAGSEGIDIDSFADDAIVRNNTVRNTVVGIRINEDGAIVRNNVVTSTRDTGIVIERDATVAGNTVTDADANGIFLDSGTTTIEDNVVRNSTGVGLFISVSPLGDEVRNNTITGSATGIKVTDSRNGSNTIADNTVLNVTGGAFVVTDESNDCCGPFVTRPESVSNLDIGNSTAANTTLDFRAYEVRVEPVSVPPADPGPRQSIGRYVEATNTAPDGFLNVTFQYETTDIEDANESALRVWQHNRSTGDWRRVDDPNEVNATADTVSANVTDLEYGVVAPLVGPSVSDYANDDGVVVTKGLLDAIDDWRNGVIELNLLLAVIDAWRSGDPVV